MNPQKLCNTSNLLLDVWIKKKILIDKKRIKGKYLKCGNLLYSIKLLYSYF